MYTRVCTTLVTCFTFGLHKLALSENFRGLVDILQRVEIRIKKSLSIFDLSSTSLQSNQGDGILFSITYMLF